MSSKTCSTSALRSDTQSFPSVALTPLPARLNPRASFLSVRPAVVALLRAVLVLAGSAAAVLVLAAFATVWVLSGAPDVVLLVLALVLLASYPAAAARTARVVR